MIVILDNGIKIDISNKKYYVPLVSSPMFKQMFPQSPNYKEFPIDAFTPEIQKQIKKVESELKGEK